MTETIKGMHNPHTRRRQKGGLTIQLAVTDSLAQMLSGAVVRSHGTIVCLSTRYWDELF